MPEGKPLVIVVGGFLGAGKTTLILCAADMLMRRGTRVAVITNDQGQNLVDTHRARAEGIDTVEIGGGCFCCQFSTLIESAESMMRYRPEVIFAEPVGSCTDLAATVLQPLQALYSHRFRLAPFTVLVDPAIARRSLKPGGDPHLRFLFESQVREADVVCYTKADQYSYFPEIFDDEPLRISAITGEGVRGWLDVVTGWQGKCGGNVLTIDYDQYAAAEAALGWLNARLVIDLQVPSSPANLIGPVLEQLDHSLELAGARIVHLKLFDQTRSSYLKAGIVNNGQEPAVEGDLLAPAERKHELVINLRAIAHPALLLKVVEEAVATIAGEVQKDIQAFAPSYPKPEKRMSAGG